MSALDELIEDSGGRVVRYALVVLVVAAVVFILTFANWRTIGGLDFSAIWLYRYPLLVGLGVTLLLTAVAAVSGLVTGTVFAIGSQSPIAPLRWLIVAFVEVFRDTPMLVQLMWIHFALPLLTGINTTPAVSGVICIALHASAYFTELMRGGIQAVPRSQWEAAFALGIPAWTRWTRVILPQAIRIALPPLVSLIISFFKATAILSVLQVGELMSVASRISNATFRPIEMFSFVALVYFVIGYGMSRGALLLEGRLARGGGGAR